ncbi:DUF555 domain-containing protein [Halosimplex aquaticum]
MNPDAASSKDWYQVRLTVPWVVPGAPGVQDAINISVAEVGKRASASNVRSCDIEVQDLACPGCGYEMEAALCTTGYGMVVLDVTVEVTARSLEDSRTVAKRAGLADERHPADRNRGRPIGDWRHSGPGTSRPWCAIYTAPRIESDVNEVSASHCRDPAGTLR